MFENLKAGWNARSSSEKRTLIIGGILLIGMLYFSMVWAPLSKKLASTDESISSLQQQKVWMQQSAQQIRASGAANSRANASQRQSLLAITDRTLRSSGLTEALERIQPDGSSRVRVWLSAADFDQALNWLAALQNQHAISADAVGIERSETANVVSLRATLSRQSGADS